MKKLKKTQTIWKTLEQTQGSQKNPRTQDWIEKPKILGENPRGGNAGYFDSSKSDDCALYDSF